MSNNNGGADDRVEESTILQSMRQGKSNQTPSSPKHQIHAQNLAALSFSASAEHSRGDLLRGENDSLALLHRLPPKNSSKRKVPYRDFSMIPGEASGLGVTAEPWAGADARQPPPVPAKIYAILSNPEHERIVSWLPHGRAWKIHDLGKFGTQVLPLYFDLDLGMFLRLLKLWGFSQLTKFPDRSAYYNEVSTFKYSIYRQMLFSLIFLMSCVLSPFSCSFVGSHIFTGPCAPTPVRA